MTAVGGVEGVGSGMSGLPSNEVEVLERAVGRSGELVLRRNGADLEIIAGGTFLVSSANAVSSEALVRAALPYLVGRPEPAPGEPVRDADAGVGAEIEGPCAGAPADFEGVDPGARAADARGGAGSGDGSALALRVLIGGLGLGHALDVALAEPAVADVTVAEYEPAIVEWFRKYGEGRAVRLGAAEAAGRARVVVADVADVLRAAAAAAQDAPEDGAASGSCDGAASGSCDRAASGPSDRAGGDGAFERAALHGPSGRIAGDGAFDLVALDTDNGPDWLVREANAGLYDEAGVRLAHDALRSGGVAVFWSPERYEWFARRLAAVFADVHEVAAHDRIGRHCHEYTMYVALRGVD